MIFTALSLQYTVMSALMYRVPFHNKIDNIADFFTDSQYKNLRP